LVFFCIIVNEKKTLFMKFVRVVEDYEHLWAVKEPDKEFDELTSLFEKWNNTDYLLDFF
jgi:ferritin